MALNVGSVGVTVYPDTTNFWRRFEAQTAPGARAAGRSVADNMTNQIAPEMARQVNEGANSSAVRQAGQRAGANFGDAFSRDVTARIGKALSQLPKSEIRVDADTDPAKAALRKLREELAFTSVQVRYGLMEDNDVEAKLAGLHAELARLSTESPNIRVRVDTGAAAAELAAFAAAVDGVSAAIGGDGGGGGGGGGARSGGGRGGPRGIGTLSGRMRLILNLLAFLGPALIPVGAAAIGAFSAMGIAAGVGAAAIYGLVNRTSELASVAFDSRWSEFTTELKNLSSPAAEGFVEGLAKSLSEINRILPSFTDNFHRLGQDIGIVSGNVGLGLLAWAQAFMPLAYQIGNALATWSIGFANIGSNQAFLNFVEYIRREGPIVASVLSELGQAVVRILRAFEPWGSIVLTAIEALSSVVNSLPIGVLQGLTLIFEAWMTYRIVGSILTGIAAGLGRIGLSATAAAASTTAARVSLLNFAGGSGLATGLTAGLSAVLLVGTLIWQRHANAVAAAKNRMAEYTNAIRDDNGVIGENSEKLAVQRLQTLKAFDAAQKLGISQRTLVDAAEGNAEAYKTVTDAINAVTTANDKASAGGKSLTETQKAQDNAATSLQSSLNEVSGELGHSAEEAAALQKQLIALNGGVMPLKEISAITSDLGRELGISADAAGDLAQSLGFDDKDQATQGRIDAIKGLNQVLLTANDTQRTLIDAQLEYAHSAGTAADKAKLMGATLIAANGDTLSYAGVIGQAAKANQDLAETFEDDDLAGKLRVFADSLHGVDFAQLSVTDAIKLFSQTAAPELTDQLANIQKAAADAAEATYTHEVKTKGAADAAADASVAYQTLVDGALANLKKEAGLTDQQVDDLRQTFLKMDGQTATATLITEGLTDAVTALEDIALQMANLNGKHYTTYLELKYNVDPAQALDAANRYANLNPSADGAIVRQRADGGVERVAQIAPAGSYILWAESETEDESYIPHAQSKRGRATAILAQTAADFGYDIVRKYRDGGMTKPMAAGRNNWAGATITVNEVTDTTGTIMALNRELSML